jgi:hypothetical protein
MKGVPKRKEKKIENIDEGIEFLPLNQFEETAIGKNMRKKVMRERQRGRGGDERDKESPHLEEGRARDLDVFCANYNWGSIPNSKRKVIPLLLQYS